MNWNDCSCAHSSGARGLSVGELGAVRFLGASIGSDLSCVGGKFLGKDKKGNALIADRLTTTGSVFLRQGFEAAGAVRLLGAKIGGNLDCLGGKFLGQDEDGNALIADQLITTGNVFLSQGFEAAGAVRLLGAKIGGNFDCVGGKFRGNDKDGNALYADGLMTMGSVLLSRGFEAAGVVRLLACKIGADLICEGGKFRGNDKRVPLAIGMSMKAVPGVVLFGATRATLGSLLSIRIVTPP